MEDAVIVALLRFKAIYQALEDLSRNTSSSSDAVSAVDASALIKRIHDHTFIFCLILLKTFLPELDQFRGFCKVSSWTSGLLRNASRH